MTFGSKKLPNRFLVHSADLIKSWSNPESMRVVWSTTSCSTFSADEVNPRQTTTASSIPSPGGGRAGRGRGVGCSRSCGVAVMYVEISAAQALPARGEGERFEHSAVRWSGQDVLEIPSQRTREPQHLARRVQEQRCL